MILAISLRMIPRISVSSYNRPSPPLIKGPLIYLVSLQNLAICLDKLALVVRRYLLVW